MSVVQRLRRHSAFWTSLGGIFLVAAVALASPGDLNTGFGNGGVVIEDLGPIDGTGMAGAVDAQGRVLALAQYNEPDDRDFVVYRYLPNGDLDTSWGQGGVAQIDVDDDDDASDIALTADGGVVIVGTSGPAQARDMSIVKLTASGVLDTAFSSDGKLELNFSFTDAGNGVAVAPDGRIFAIGTADEGSARDIAVAAVHPGGQLDASFDGDGRAVLDLGGDEAGRAVTVLPNGSVVVAGQTDGDMVLAVLQPSGNPDPAFAGDGVTTYDAGGMFDTAQAVAVDAAGGLLLAGFATNGEFVALRYNPNGHLDSDFGEQGAQRFFPAGTPGVLEDLAVAPTGHVVLAGHNGLFPNRDVVVARLTASGELDEAFGQDGLITTDIGGDDIARGVVVNGDGAVFVFGGTNAAGTRDLLIAKYEGTSPQDDPEPDPALECTDAFNDDEGHVFEGDINCIAAADITRGCNPPVNDRFCPDSTVTRGQMAAFLTRALSLDPGNGTFNDTNGHTFEADIAALAAADITRGCNPPVNDRFCPDSTVTRGQMAAFLTRALNLTPSEQTFADTNGHVFEQDIAALAAAGITKGCNPPDNTRFCPDEPVTRGQMAAFLNRALVAG